MKQYALVGDIGGTNIRFAICKMNNGTLSHIETFLTSKYDNLENIIKYYLNLHKNYDIKNGCIAIACPVTNDYIEMTNHNWAFSIKQLKKNIHFDNLEIINDFTAVSMAIPMLKTNNLIQFGGKTPLKNKPIAIYGAGTGLGVSALININKQWINFAGEGGHVDFAPNNVEEDKILEILRKEHGRVSAERILSGIGLVNIYRAIVKSNNLIPKNLKPKDVSKLALTNNCIYCHKALSLFCVIMGRFGGNLALTLGAFGGVYIAGGIIPNFLNFFKKSGFREAFEDKGRLRQYVIDIPVYMITHDQPGLLGAGMYLRQMLKCIT